MEIGGKQTFESEGIQYEIVTVVALTVSHFFWCSAPGKCVDGTIMAIVISVAAFLLISSVGTCYVKYRNHKADEIWQVQIEEVSYFFLTSDVYQYTILFFSNLT